MKPLAVDLYCGLGGWTDGLLAQGYDVVGFDIESHQYGDHKYPAQLVLQDVLTLHGSQFKDAALIVASPPCQAYSYRAMPWKRAKALPPPDNALFDACFRIQREASEAAGRHIPMVVENVCGAQRWVGQARWHYGSYYLWGDVPALMPIVRRTVKVPGFRFDGSGRSFQSASVEGVKAGDRNKARANGGHEWTTGFDKHMRIAGRQALSDGIKHGGTWFHDSTSPSRLSSAKSPARKAASAMIAKIPFALADYIARIYKPKAALAAPPEPPKEAR